MKKVYLFLISISFFFKSQASVLLVNNATAGAGQYTVIDSAMAHANAGDTIYISGSNITYSSFTISKSIVVLGAGSLSDKQNSFATKVNGFKCNSNLSNIKVKGLFIAGNADFSSKVSVSQLEVSGNYVQGYFDFSGSTNFSFINIANNIFALNSLDRIDFVFATGFSNVLIQNNILFGSVRSLSAPGSVISHNVFITITNAFDFFSTSFFSGVMIRDNIFYNSNPITNTLSCTYSNNLSYSTSLTYPAMSGSGNLNNVDPNFINVTTGGYSTAFNFQLQAGSPAIGAASDGTDLGFYGGTLPASVSGETENMPVVRKMDIVNINLPQNGSVNVKVRSTKAR